MGNEVVLVDGQARGGGSRLSADGRGALGERPLAPCPGKTRTVSGNAISLPIEWQSIRASSSAVTPNDATRSGRAMSPMTTVSPVSTP